MSPVFDTVLLPSKHRLVELLIHDIHERVKHNRIQDTLTTIRKQFWILHGRESVKRLIKNCIVCRKAQGQPYTGGEAPDVPASKVSESPPFTNVGLAGPLFTRNEHNDQFVQCLQEVFKLKMFTRLLLSDNAKMLKAACKEICRLCRAEEVWCYLAVTWKFIIEKASCGGGFWERFKLCL